MHGSNIPALQQLPSNSIEYPAITLSLNQWIFERIRQFISGRILFIGSNGENIIELCQNKCKHIEVARIDFTDPMFDTNNAHSTGIFEAIINLNESNSNINSIEIENCQKLLKQGGYLFTVVPARTAIYNGLEHGLKYWEEDNMRFLNALLRLHFKIIKTRYFMVKTNKDVVLETTNGNNKYVTLIEVSDSNQFNPKGLSILVVGRKRIETYLDV